VSGHVGDESDGQAVSSTVMGHLDSRIAAEYRLRRASPM
jgi:hypothetical protein